MNNAIAHAMKASDQPVTNSAMFPNGESDVQDDQKMISEGGKRTVAFELSASMLLIAALPYEVAVSIRSAIA